MGFPPSQHSSLSESSERGPLTRMFAVAGKQFGLYFVRYMLAQIENTDLRCVTLESPKKLYDNLLLNIYGNIGEKEKDVFKFSFRNDLGTRDLEGRNLLEWFQILEQREKLSWTDVNSLVDYLKEASLYALVSEARQYQARIRVIVFFQRHLQERLSVRLDQNLNEKWCSEHTKLPKNYLVKCQELFRGKQNYDVTLNHVRSLFSKGIVLLEKSCSGNDLKLACFKLVYLADLFFQRFEKMIGDDKELLNIKPLPTGKFLPLDKRRRRTSVTQRRRSSVPVAGEHQLSQRRSLIEDNTLITVTICLLFLLAKAWTLLSSLMGGNDTVNR